MSYSPFTTPGTLKKLYFFLDGPFLLEPRAHPQTEQVAWVSLENTMECAKEGCIWKTNSITSSYFDEKGPSA